MEQCGVLGDSVRPLDLKIFSEQGKNVSLSCSYSTSFSLEYYLYWYLQFPFREPEYILYKSNKNSYSHSADFAKNRFVSEVNSNYTTLTITDLKPEDSATYHCALQRAQCDRAKQSSYTNLRMEKNRTSSNSALTFPFQLIIINMK
ncbi:hypothetical protein XENTR_v10002050 [Xenopus tropicalis]|nr:hypothetical protein XENTR_v10002050 [Xenopus tropicalis]